MGHTWTSFKFCTLVLILHSLYDNILLILCKIFPGQGWCYRRTLSSKGRWQTWVSAAPLGGVCHQHEATEEILRGPGHPASLPWNGIQRDLASCAQVHAEAHSSQEWSLLSLEGCQETFRVLFLPIQPEATGLLNHRVLLH